VERVPTDLGKVIMRIAGELVRIRQVVRLQTDGAQYRVFK
jgi:hypothetical protein